MPDVPAALSTYMEGLKTHDLDKIASSFADGVVFVTPARTMKRDEILAFLAALYRGFPDWHYDHDPPVFREDGAIGVKWRQGGTHTDTLEFPGFDACPATGKSVTIPEHFFYYRVGETGLREIRPDPVPGGAPRGIFEQIGVELPPL
ncbi:MAG: nuclear transport factor 2 family protein [Akkermansiaceae bacterium]|nr:nuclear transport factor 2 family protein [Akkermansiaceae bacterium]